MGDHANVSVILTCYNLEKYIGDAIDSVLAQDYSGGVEIIVVDDASTDRSREIVGSYDRVKLIRMPVNSGVLLATIAGIRSSSGDLIFFLDGDDLWYPPKLRLVVDAFNANNHIGIVTHDLDFVDLNGRRIQRESRSSQVLSVVQNAGQFVKKGILGHSDYVWLGSAYAVRRSKVELEGFCRWVASLPSPRDTYQDWPLAYWCASTRYVECAYVGQTLMSYRIHGANYSGDASTVEKAVKNLRKAYLTASAVCDICQVRGLRGYPHWLSQGKRLYCSYMLDLYRGRRVQAVSKFARLQLFLAASSIPFLKEWVRFLVILFLGVERFTLVLKG